MLLLVDNSLDGKGANAREIYSAVTRIRPNMEIWIERYQQISPETVAAAAPTHIILSGQSDPWASYAPDTLVDINRVIREATIPILGICGGHQQIALAYGAKVDVMKRVAPGEGYAGCIKKRGFGDITNHGTGLFVAVPPTFSVWHSHYEEVKELPEEFENTATSGYCAIQAMQHRSRRVAGVQFHPELFDAEHPVGQKVIDNFLNW
jgi:GMP synthase-like glutamine amidotransferase